MEEQEAHQMEEQEAHQMEGEKHANGYAIRPPGHSGPHRGRIGLSQDASWPQCT